MTHGTGNQQGQHDLVFLVADTDMRAAIGGLLARTKSLGIRKIYYAIEQHPGRDGGCRTAGVAFLRALSHDFRHAILMFDFEGCGAEQESPEMIEKSLEKSLEQSGWGDRAAVIVVEPELEQWVWTPSTEVDRILGWKSQEQSMRHWLTENNWLRSELEKPSEPKEAMRAVMRKTRKNLSPSIFGELARSVSLRSCREPSFIKLSNLLLDWFAE